MTNEKRFSIFRNARHKWSEIAQAMVACEEMGELITAVSQYYRGRDDADHVLEEIADVMLCCEQLIFNMAERHNCEYEDFETIVRETKQRKLERMEMRLNEAKNNRS